MIGNHSKYSYIAESVSLLNVYQRTIAKENPTFDRISFLWLQEFYSA